MASLRDCVKNYQDELSEGIAWVAFWREGRSWYSIGFFLELDDNAEEVLLPEQKRRLEAILAKDPETVILNGYLHGHLGTNENGEKATLANLYHGVRWHYQNGTSSKVKHFLETTDVLYKLQDETEETNQIEETESKEQLSIESAKSLEKVIHQIGKTKDSEHLNLRFSVRSAESLEEAIKSVTEIIEAVEKKYPDVSLGYDMAKETNRNGEWEITRLLEYSTLGEELQNNIKKWDEALLSDDKETCNYCSAYWEAAQSFLNYLFGTECHFSRSDDSCGIVDDEGNWLIKIR